MMSLLCSSVWTIRIDLNEIFSRKLCSLEKRYRYFMHMHVLRSFIIFIIMRISLYIYTFFCAIGIKSNNWKSRFLYIFFYISDAWLYVLIMFAWFRQKVTFEQLTFFTQKLWPILPAEYYSMTIKNERLPCLCAT